MTNATAGTMSLRTLIVLTVVALVANAVLGAMLVIGRSSFTHYTSCSTNWQQSWAVAYKARYGSAVKVSRAMDRVVAAVAAQDPDKFHAAIRHYTTLRARQDQARTSHPLPPLPDAVCGDPSP